MQVGDISYHVHIEGSGGPLVLLHGFTGSMHTWQDLIPLWKKKYQFICLDLIGHGESSKPEHAQHYLMEQAIEDLHEIMNKLNIERAHLLGYSLGGRFALQYANRYPQNVRSLILESSSPGIADEQERRDRQLQDEALANLIIEQGVPRFVERWEALPLFASQQQLDTNLRKRLKEKRLNNDAVGLANSLRAMGTGVQTSLWNELDKLPFPILLLTGDLDEKFCLIASNMEQRNSSIKWHKIENAGHNIHLEQPESYARLVQQFLQTV